MDNIQVNWMVDDTCKHKAVLKYHINQLESLFICSFSPKGTTEQLKNIKMICITLSYYYHHLIELIDELNDSSQIINRIEPDNYNWQNDFNYIVSLIKKRRATVSEKEMFKIYRALYEQYHALGQSIASYLTTSYSSYDAKIADTSIRMLLQASSTEKFLKAMSYMASQYKSAQFHAYFSSLLQLNNNQLKKIAHFFRQQKYVHIFHAIVYYKLNPCYLFPKSLHPEKLISVRSRLSLLYDAINFLYQILSQTLLHRDLPPLKDYLLHYETWPKGIALNIDSSHRKVILTALKAWHGANARKESSSMLQQIRGLFRAYKYWFNPSQLIDAVLVLQDMVEHARWEVVNEDNRRGYHKILAALGQMTTTECVDLYGYLTNNDSCYLMRTLHAVISGNNFSWLGELSFSGRLAIKRVYQVIYHLVHALRDELCSRGIKTPICKFDSYGRTVMPRGRNREAVIRIIQVYSNDMRPPNLKLESLFRTLEA